MATTLASLVVRVGADVTGVTAGLNTVQKRTRNLKKQFSSVTDSTLRMRDAFGVLAGATGMAFAAKAVFDLGAAVEETSSKFNTVFGPAVGGAQQFLDEFATTAGLTVTQGRELLATTGAIVQGMGMGQQASSEFAQEIVRLSGDFSSFNNIPIEETSRAIQSALTGERESLKRLGIVILETDVQKKALAMTGKATAAALTQQEKATATLALITERAGVAVGDLARTMESPANRARKLQAEFLTLRDDISHALLPAMAVFLGELGKIGGEEGFVGLGKKIKENSEGIAAWAKFAVETFKTVAMAIAAPVRIAFNLGEVLGKVLVAAAQAMTGNFEGARETLGSMVGDFGDMKSAITNVVDGFDNMRVASGIAWSVMSGEGGDGGSGSPAAVRESLESVAVAIDKVTERQFLLRNANREAMLELARLGLEGARAFIPPIEDSANAVSSLGQQMQSTALRGVDAFVGFATGAGDSIGQFVKRALADLAKLTAKMLFVRGIMSFLPGVGNFLGFGGEKFAGLFASGGFIPKGSFGIAGEAGREKITTGPTAVRGPAMVTPMQQSGGTTVVQFPAPRSNFERAAQDYLAEGLRQLQHSGFKVVTT